MHASVIGNDASSYLYQYNTGLIESANKVAGVLVLDTIISALSLTLGNLSHSLILTGSAKIVGTGNDLGNSIQGNGAGDKLVGGAGADAITGGSGADTIIGGGGSDTLTGGASSDTFIFAPGSGHDVITDFSNAAGGDVLDISAYTLAGVTPTVADSTQGLVITFNANDSIVLNGVHTSVAGLPGLKTSSSNSTTTTTTAPDSVSSAVSFTLAATSHNLTLTGSAAVTGLGNALDNVITSNTGVDTLVGGAGNDTYVINNSADIITEAANSGTDSVQSSVSFILPANVENITLTGTAAIDATGNGLANVIIGNAAANHITGGGGDDTLTGGGGADTFIFAPGSGHDVITDFATGDVLDISAYTRGGITATVADSTQGLVVTFDNDDSVIINGVHTSVAGLPALITASTSNSSSSSTTTTTTTTTVPDSVSSAVSFTLAATSHNLTLTGSAAVTGTGNALDNVITSNGGVDTLVGGAGNDTYVINDSADIITEAAGAGTNSVQSSVSFILPANVENITLTGASFIDATGNAQANVIIGNAAANHITGGAGDDTLTGGDGADTFIFAPGSGHDVITDFSNAAGGDILDISAYVKAGVNPTFVDSSQGMVVTFDANDSIVLLGVHTAPTGVHLIGAAASTSAVASLIFDKKHIH